MSKATVLSHVFRHGDRWHFYDTVTNDLYECDEVVAAVIPVLDELEGGGNSEVRAALDEAWGPAKVDTALREIRELREETKALEPRDLKIITRCACCHAADQYEDSIGHLQLTITEQCNLRCRYCPYTIGRTGARVHNEATMTPQTLRAAIEFFMAHNAQKEQPAVSFYGGEPLLAFDLLREGIAQVRRLQGDREAQIHVDTNGTLIDAEVARLLVDEKCHIQISLDGPRDLHDRYRRCRDGEGTFDRVIAGLRTLLDLDPEVHERIRFNAVVAPPYALKRVIDYFADFPLYREYGITEQPSASVDFADLSYMDFHPVEMEGFEPTDPVRDMEDFFAVYLEACRKDERSGLAPAIRQFFDQEIIQHFHRSRAILPDEVFPTGSCQPGQRKIHVRADGSILPCERGSDSMFIGHVNTGIDLKKVHNVYEKLIGSVGERCRTCWAIRSCKICFIHMASTWQEDGRGQIGVPEEICENARSSAATFFPRYLALKELGPAASAWLKDTRVE